MISYQSHLHNNEVWQLRYRNIYIKFVVVLSLHFKHLHYAKVRKWGLPCRPHISSYQCRIQSFFGHPVTYTYCVLEWNLRAPTRFVVVPDKIGT